MGRDIISGFVREWDRDKERERERKNEIRISSQTFRVETHVNNIEPPFHPRYSIPFKVDDSRVLITCDRRREVNFFLHFNAMETRTQPVTFIYAM